MSNSLRPHELQHARASLSITNSRSLLKLMSTESVMPSSHLILCRSLLLLPPIPPSIRIFSNESTLCMRWPSTGVSALASFQDWSPLEWTGWNTHLYPATIYHSELWVRQQRGKSPGSWNIRTRSEFLLYPLLDIWSWVSFFLSLYLNFPLCIMELITIPPHTLFLRD